MEFSNLAMILIFLLKNILIYHTDASQESSLSYKSDDIPQSHKRYRRSGMIWLEKTHHVNSQLLYIKRFIYPGYHIVVLVV